jgi:hypothetical protein
MRKLLALLLAFSLLGFAPAQAAVKAGGKCTKAGTVITSVGKKFTCIRSGGKLVWNKGVVIKKVAAIKAGVCKDPGITQVRANALLTMSESNAEMCAMDLDWIYRLGQRDDEMFAGTFDYRIDRVTVTVMKGVVTQVNVG